MEIQKVISEEGKTNDFRRNRVREKFRLKEDKKFEHYKIMLPKLRENDVMIKIAAISISTLDTQIRQTIKGAKTLYFRLWWRRNHHSSWQQ